MYSSTEIIGRLGRDPEMRYTPSGVPVTNFSVAVDKTWTDESGQRHEKTQWYKVTTWRQMAENCGKFLAKGSQVLVRGGIDAELYTTRDGESRVNLVITADKVVFLSSAGKDASDDQTVTSDRQSVLEEDIPF